MKKTKIIATIGPTSERKEILEKLIASGVDVARLNFSHGSHKEHGDRINLIRKIEKKLNKHVAIIADIQGPKIRIGNLPDKGIELKTGQEIIIDTGTREYYQDRIPLPSLLFRDGTKENHIVYLDDGTIQIKIISKRSGIFKAEVLKGGILFPKKGVNVPSLEIDSLLLSAKDKADIDFAVKAGADYIALSFLRNANDLKEARKFLGKSKIKIISKIERPEALKNIEEIIEETDAVMIARGDLGIETPLWELPIRQKEIIELVRKKMKPVIVATQMLDSMIRNPIPTRAEVSDVANAVFDLTDAVMLSGESASGKYPVEAVEMMKRILESTDIHQNYSQENPTYLNNSLDYLIAKSVAHIAEEMNAGAIVIESSEKNLFKFVSYFRPKAQIVLATENVNEARLSALVWGTMPLLIKKAKKIEIAKKTIKSLGLTSVGDKIICVYKNKSQGYNIITETI